MSPAGSPDGGAPGGPAGLAGLRVLDLTHVIAGPFATHQLAQLGAEVIKIEHPERPDVARAMGAGAGRGMGALYRAHAAGKRAVALDLGDPRDRADFERLLAGADVLVENYRAGALARFGLDYPTLAARRPDLVYCSITGFGQTGPRAGWTAYDNVIQAGFGLMSMNAAGAGRPIKIGAPVVDYATGLAAAFGVAAALVQRARTGRGDHVDVAMSETALSLASVAVLRATELLGAGAEAVDGDAAAHPGLALYAAREGALMLGAMTERQWARLAALLGDAELAARFARLGETESAAWARARLARRFAAETAAHWEAALNAAGVPAQRLRGLAEAVTDPALAARDALAPVDDGPGRAPRAAARLRGAPRPAFRPAPRLGADDAALLGRARPPRAGAEAPARLD